jgi:hypothetical protein
MFPVQMSLSIFTEEARRTSCAWRPLGYITNEDFYYSSAKIKANNADTKNERFHCQLEVILPCTTLKSPTRFLIHLLK